MTKLTNSFTFTKRSAKILAIFILLACGPGMADYDEFMSFFMPESTNATVQNQKYHYTPMFFYNDNENENFFSEESDTSTKTEIVDPCKIENLKAWQIYCQGKVAEKDIEQGIYGVFQNSKLKKFFQSAKNQAAINYVELAQNAEKIFVTSTEPYSDVAEIDSSLTLDLVNNAQNLASKIKNTKDDFLKERFGFQVVKLLSIAQKHEEAIESFNKLITPIKSKSFISDWALMRKAESETALGETAQAYYDFAQVFDRSASHRSQADLVVRARIDSLEIDDEVLNFCKNDHEKAAVYAFAGIKPGLDILPILEKLVEIDPKNPMIELIMAREINKNERFYYPPNFYTYYGEDTTQLHEGKVNSVNYWSKLKDFSLKCTDNQNLTKTGFWQTASAYMEYVQGDFGKAEQFLTQAKAINTTNEALKNQILIQELLLTAKKGKEITSETEMAYLPILEKFAKPINFRVSNAILETCKILGTKYRGQTPQTEEKKGGLFSGCSNKDKTTNGSSAGSVPHATAKAYLLTMLTTNQVNSSEKYGGFESQKDMFPIEDTTSLATIEKVIAYFSETNKSDFDKRLQKLVGFNNDHLYTLMGRRAVDENNYAKAAEAFAKVTPSVWKSEEWKTMFNEEPFYISTIYGQEIPNKSYNPYTFTKKMAELEAKVKANPDDTESVYLLGCGSFNTTYYGNAWILRRHSRSSAEVNNYTKSNYNSDYYKATKAKEFFLLNMKSADKEIAAKACFGAALCERATFETYAASEEFRADEDYESFGKRMQKERGENFSSYFKLLNKRFKNTKYEAQVLSECGDYSEFTAP